MPGRNKSFETIPFKGEKSTRGCLTDGAHLSSKDSGLHRHLSEVLSRIPAGTPWALIPHQFSVVVVKMMGGWGWERQRGETGELLRRRTRARAKSRMGWRREGQVNKEK